MIFINFIFWPLQFLQVQTRTKPVRFWFILQFDAISSAVFPHTFISSLSHDAVRHRAVRTIPLNAESFRQVLKSMSFVWVEFSADSHGVQIIIGKWHAKVPLIGSIEKT